MSILEGITINGVPLKVYVDEADRDEKQEFRVRELQIMGKTIRTHSHTKNYRNQSGARSGKCRIIYSRAAAAGGVA